ncbi:unnamed protein product [Cyclocybe aegerita]|uniref:Uncharacterized protein n=1 Tax=Cyclocybe aegerita TaxID=1973307 RepID=A0A8S0XDH4_CYCAE|nr:unnamed protein product [Cyclocybe aegerita]
MEDPTLLYGVHVLKGLVAVLATSLPITAFFTYLDFNRATRTWDKYLTFGHNLSVIASLLVSFIATTMALGQEIEVKLLDVTIISAIILLISTNMLRKIYALGLSDGLRWLPHIASPVIVALHISSLLIPMAIETFRREKYTTITFVTTFLAIGTAALLLAARSGQLIPKVRQNWAKVYATLGLSILNDLASLGSTVFGAWYKIRVLEGKLVFNAAHLHAILLFLHPTEPITLGSPSTAKFIDPGISHHGPITSSSSDISSFPPQPSTNANTNTIIDMDMKNCTGNRKSIYIDSVVVVDAKFTAYVWLEADIFEGDRRFLKFLNEKRDWNGFAKCRTSSYYEVCQAAAPVDLGDKNCNVKNFVEMRLVGSRWTVCIEVRVHREVTPEQWAGNHDFEAAVALCLKEKKWESVTTKEIAEDTDGEDTDGEDTNGEDDVDRES